MSANNRCHLIFAKAELHFDLKISTRSAVTNTAMSPTTEFSFR
ncbi:hypothetical protein SynMITS9220_01860 [Synechococcus sp. MIT S9220]|nr:hypothetical protein SynMITS9220_01860 [Synechococcus sp. MIT S9220]